MRTMQKPNAVVPHEDDGYFVAAPQAVELLSSAVEALVTAFPEPRFDEIFNPRHERNVETGEELPCWLVYVSNPITYHEQAVYAAFLAGYIAAASRAVGLFRME